MNMTSPSFQIYMGTSAFVGGTPGVSLSPLPKTSAMFSPSISPMLPRISGDAFAMVHSDALQADRIALVLSARRFGMDAAQNFGFSADTASPHPSVIIPFYRANEASVTASSEQLASPHITPHFRWTFDPETFPWGGAPAGDREEEYQQHLSRASELLKHFSVPDHIQVTLEDIQKSYNPGEWHWYFGMALAFVGSSGDESATMLHEIGHNIFYLNLGRYSDGWRELTAQHEQIREEYEGLQLDPQDVDPREWRQTVRETEGDLPYHFMNMLTNPYNELFADLLAVMVTGDPQRMRSPSGGGSREFLRDFTRIFTPEEVHNWNPDDPPEYGHTILDPVRSFIYHHLLADPASEQQLPEILRFLFEVIAQEIAAREADHSLHQLPSPVMNQRLIAAIESALEEKSPLR